MSEKERVINWAIMRCPQEWRTEPMRKLLEAVYDAGFEDGRGTDSQRD